MSLPVNISTISVHLKLYLTAIDMIRFLWYVHSGKCLFTMCIVYVCHTLGKRKLANVVHTLASGESPATIYTDPDSQAG